MSPSKTSKSFAYLSSTPRLYMSLLTMGSHQAAVCLPAPRDLTPFRGSPGTALTCCGAPFFYALDFMTGQEYHCACCLLSPCQQHTDSYSPVVLAPRNCTQLSIYFDHRRCGNYAVLRFGLWRTC